MAQLFRARLDRKPPRLALLTLLESFVRQTIIGNNLSAALHTGSKSTHYIKRKSLACTEANLHRKEESTKAAGLVGTCSRLGVGRTINGGELPRGSHYLVVSGVGTTYATRVMGSNLSKLPIGMSEKGFPGRAPHGFAGIAGREQEPGHINKNIAYIS